MSREFSIHWLEDTVEKVMSRNPLEITLSTGKTPSGHIHVGILREIIICDALSRIFNKKGKKVNFYLFLDDFDAAKRFPDYIDAKFQREHIGKPFALIPCPFKSCGCESYARHFGNELISTFKDFGIKNEIIWTFDLYKERRMQEKIKIALEKTDEIKKILKKYIFPTLDDEKKERFVEMQTSWMPVMVLCEYCNRIQKKGEDGSIKPNRVISYSRDDDEVSYNCPVCGHQGKISIYSGRLKLNWRIDWPAKWSLFNTSCEPAGKDHCVKGGSYDTGLEICHRIYNYQGPVKLSYEWLRLGDQDMKTSKGIVFTPKRFQELADPEIYRMLILRTNPMKHISLRIEELSQYYNYYEKMENIYYNIEEAESTEEKDFLIYLYPLTKIENVPESKPIRIPFNNMIFLSQVQNLLSKENLYNKALSWVDREVAEITFVEFDNLLTQTTNWILEVKSIINKIETEKKKKFLLNKIGIFSIPVEINKSLIDKLNQNQISGLKLFRDFILKEENMNAEKIQNEIFNIAKQSLQINPKELFKALYLVILGKNSGPRLGSFMALLDKEWLQRRLDFLNI
ncbi:MAG: lysine--tRNA ligase [Candidatus Lokiarchaeota archaeon]|nr:lysine--tRNA ligase [Candidatus Lokiarchaeota archaeon]